MIVLVKALTREKLDAHLLLQVHDELVLEVKPEHLDAVKDILRSEAFCMPLGAMRVKMEIKLSQGSDWASLQAVE
eukprot:m.213921 g.213921  ORF g.213921 m.213921 type:complete len:75 (+) comp17182_c0_seq2:2281-2505(+)